MTMQVPSQYRLGTYFARCVCRFGDRVEMETQIAQMEERMFKADSGGGNRARTAVLAALAGCSEIDPSFETLKDLALDALEKVERNADVFTSPDIMSLEEVLAFYDVSRSTFYNRMREGIYPQPIKIKGTRKAAWSRPEIERARAACA